MSARSNILRGTLLALALLSGLARAEEASAGALKALLPSLQGTERLTALLRLANALESEQPQEALGFATEGLALAVREGDREKEAAFLSTATFCCSQTGDFALAIEYGRKALALGIELGDKDRIAKVHNALGITYTFVGAYSQALEESFEALRLREELGQEKAVSQSLNLIGVVYHHSGQYEKAIDYFNQILKRVEAKPDPKRLILAKHNLGFAQYKLGRLQEALKNHQEALALSTAIGEKAYIPYAHLNLGLTYSELKQFGRADTYLRKAQAEYQERDQKHGMVQVLRARARLDLLMGRLAAGIPLAREGADLARAINARDELKLCYELMSELYGKASDAAAAFRYYKLAVLTRDSIYSVVESQKMAEAALKAATQKKDSEIEGLKRDKLISDLRIGKQRYITFILISSTGFLVTLVLVLGTYARKIRGHRAALERTNDELARTNSELQERMREIKTLSGLLPICSQCKKIRDDAGYWTQLEGYISTHTSATFSHGICPHCAQALHLERAERLRAKAMPAPSGP